jgi:hypothetical protein
LRWHDIEDDRRLQIAHPLLREAIAHVAHYQIRNRGTVGGSLAHADPAAELPGIAVTCDAEISLVGVAGARTIRAGGGRSFGSCSSKPETCRLRHNMIGKGPLSSSCAAVERGGGGGRSAARRRSWHKTGPASNSPAALLANSPKRRSRRLVVAHKLAVCETRFIVPLHDVRPLPAN